MKQIILRKPELFDAEAFLAISRDRDVMEFYGDEPLKDLNHAKEVLTWFSENHNRTGSKWVIADRESNEFLGDIEFHSFIEDHNRVQIGFRLLKEYWDQGIMTQCLKNALHTGFHLYEYNRIEALVDLRNFPSKNLLKKCGFRKEGVLRGYEFEQGQPLDLEMYSVLKEGQTMGKKKKEHIVFDGVNRIKRSVNRMQFKTVKKNRDKRVKFLTAKNNNRDMVKHTEPSHLMELVLKSM